MSERKRDLLDALTKPRPRKTWQEMTPKERDTFRKAVRPVMEWREERTNQLEKKVIEHEATHKAEAEKKRADASERGKHSKRREIIYREILILLKANPPATNNEVWKSFPENKSDAETVGEDLSESVFRDGERLYQVDSSGKIDRLRSIGRAKFNDYMTKARDELDISTRRKKRQKR